MLLWRTGGNKPEIQASVTVEESTILTVCYRKEQLTKVGDFVLPNEGQDTGVLEKILVMTSKLQESAPNTEDVLKATTALLDILGEKLSCEMCDTIKHWKDQLILISTRSPRYSSEMMVLYCFLYTISPHAYKFLRHSGVFLLTPSLSASAARHVTSRHKLNWTTTFCRT